MVKWTNNDNKMIDVEVDVNADVDVNIDVDVWLYIYISYIHLVRSWITTNEQMVVTVAVNGNR